MNRLKNILQKSSTNARFHDDTNAQLLVIFQGNTRISRYQIERSNVSILDYIGAMEVVVTAGTTRGEQSSSQSVITNTTFYRPDAIPVARPKEQ